MSTEPSPDPQLIEETKQQIRGLVREIAQLAKSDSSPEEFHGEFLPRVISALAAVGGVVWVVGDDGRLNLQYQVNLQQTGLHEDEEGQMRHGRLLQKVMTGGEGLLVAPHSGAGDDEQAANPTDFLLVLGPLQTDQETVGVLEIFQRGDAAPATQRGYLRFVLQMCDLAGEYLKTRQLRHYSDRQALWGQLEDFTRAVHSSLDPRETAYVIANEGRRLIECDRVSVAIRKGRRCTVEAVSGQDVFDKRSNVVTLLARLAGAVVATGDPVWYTGDTSDMAPQVEDAVQEYVDESHSKTVAVLPLMRPKTADSEDVDDQDARDEKNQQAIGAVIVEQIEDARIPESMMQRVDVVAQHSSSAMANALEHHSLFLMPLWRLLGKSRVLTKARNLPKTLTALVILVALLVTLFIVPADFELQSKGTLEPVNRQDVFAGVKGVVIDVKVKHGDLVSGPSGPPDQQEPGDELVIMESTPLAIEMEKVVGQIAAKEKQIGAVGRLLHDTRLSEQERTRYAGELLQFGAERKALVDQKNLYLQQHAKLTVTSPMDGQIVTWDVEERLDRRPVERGQVLLRVADPTGSWQLELHMPEHRMGHILRALGELKAENAAEGRNEKLLVTFILATDPGMSFEGYVTEIDQAAEIRGEEGNTVLIKVEIDKKSLQDRGVKLRPGATVTAKVYCGRRSVGYVWFHDAIAFVQSRILFRF